MKKIIILILLGSPIITNAQMVQYFNNEANYGHFNGAVLVKQADSVLLEVCSGLANKEQEITLQTTFDIGSITKQFTATAILQLVDQGKISLNQPINQYLGELGSKRWKNVTVHHLLTHTSGIPSLFQTEQGLEIFYPTAEPIALPALIDRFRDGKLLHSPGEEFSYSNSGYVLLARIIEQVSGLPYQAYLQKHIFDRYNLRNTSFGKTGDFALPYYGYRHDLLKPAPIYHPSWFIGAGGVYSSALDLSKWAQIVTRSDFMNPKLKALLFTKHTRAGNGHYGYGWVINKDSLVSHDGGNAGYMSTLSIDFATGMHQVILTNRSFENIHDFGKSANQLKNWSDDIWKWLAGESIEALPEIKPVKPVTGELCLNGKPLIIQQQDSIGTIRLDEGSPARIIANTPLEDSSTASVKLLLITELLAGNKYWKLARYCDGEMRFVAYSGLLRMGMNMMRKQTGEVQEMIPYLADKGHGVIRMIGEEAILDMIVYYDDEGRIQGIFEHGNYELDKAQQMIAYPIGNNQLYLDGFPYGEKSATLTVENGQLNVSQSGRTVRLDACPE